MKWYWGKAWIERRHDAGQYFRSHASIDLMMKMCVGSSTSQLIGFSG